MIKIVIAEDQNMVLGALSALLNLEPDIEVVGLAQNGIEALALIEQHQPDIVLTDIEMPQMSGIELAQKIQQLGSDKQKIRVVVLTTFARSGYLKRALDAGVRGYLLKDSPSEKLANAIREIHQGGRVVAPELITDAWMEVDPLTERERDVLRLAFEGMSSNDIGLKLHISTGTVRNYLSNAASKLNASNRFEAARIARQKGFL